MKKIILLSLCVALYAVTYAQTPSSILTIFSEDGHKFFLILNGQRQNDKSETNIRVEKLTQNFYSCKIIFEDKTLGEISKNIPVTNSADNGPADVTYKIKAGKDGKQVLRFYTSTPITADAPPVAPPDVPVYNSGVTTPVSTTTSVTQTTTTETAGVNPNTNVNINVPGINVNVNMPGMGTNGAVQQTTTTTTTTTTSSPANIAPAATQQTPPPVSPAGCNGYAMAPGDYKSAKSTIEQASFEESKLSTAKEIASANCLYASQVAEICKLFGFEESKLTFAKYAYKRCIDPQNYFKVNNVFDFDASKTELSSFTRH